jgi:hypothetical protein
LGRKVHSSMSDNRSCRACCLTAECYRGCVASVAWVSAAEVSSACSPVPWPSARARPRVGGATAQPPVAGSPPSAGGHGRRPDEGLVRRRCSPPLAGRTVTDDSGPGHSIAFAQAPLDQSPAHDLSPVPYAALKRAELAVRATPRVQMLQAPQKLLGRHVALLPQPPQDLEPYGLEGVLPGPPVPRSGRAITMRRAGQSEAQAISAAGVQQAAPEDVEQ